MGRSLSVAMLGVLGGCAQLAGIDDTTGPGVVPPEQVSLKFERVSIGATVEHAPLDLTGFTATYLVPDAAAADGLSRIPATQAALDTWAAPIPEGTPPVLFTLPDVPKSLTRVWSFPNRNVVGQFGQLEHPHPTPAVDGAMITVDVALDAAYAATDAFYLYTVGTWTNRGFSGPELPPIGGARLGPVTFPYASLSSMVGRPLEKVTTADAPLLLRYSGSRLAGTLQIPPFDQSGADTLTGTLTSTVRDQMLTAKLSVATVAGRYAPARPAVANVQMSWALVAAPGAALANNSGPALDSAGVAPTDPGMLAVPYGNPFAARGWTTTLQWATSASRTFTPAGQTLPVTLYGALYEVALPTPNITMDLPASLPEALAIDGKPLSSDGIMIAKPTKSVSLTFIAATPCTLYQMQLFDLVPNVANTALEYRHVVSSSGVKPELPMPPESFVGGHSYTLRAICVAGSYPALADGDLTKRELPVAVGYFDSGVFTVTP